MTGSVIGWDIGGANIKAARIAHAGDAAPMVVSRPFSLWRRPEALPGVLADMAARLGGSDATAVTMTAELADCFETRREGVGAVLDALGVVCPSAEPRVFSVQGRFLAVGRARAAPGLVASANWMATATFASRWTANALLMDVGSTTTDLIPIVAGRVAAEGTTDMTRLGAGELVYTGVLRTPVCAVVRTVPVRDRWHRVVAERFAQTADVHAWLGAIDEAVYTCETPDARGRSRSECGARLARMVGADAGDLDTADIDGIAEHVHRVQVRQIAGSVRRILGRLEPGAPAVAVVTGQGAFLARSAAARCGLALRDLAAELGDAAAAAMPAVAVAYLLADGG